MTFRPLLLLVALGSLTTGSGLVRAQPAPEAPPDPTPLLKASLDETQGDDKRLKAELAALQIDLKAKLDQCKPIEPPKPPPPPPQPQVAVASPVADPASPPSVPVPSNPSMPAARDSLVAATAIAQGKLVAF